jgi:hypothetical protein
VYALSCAIWMLTSGKAVHSLEGSGTPLVDDRDGERPSACGMACVDHATGQRGRRCWTVPSQVIWILHWRPERRRHRGHRTTRGLTA